MIFSTESGAQRKVPNSTSLSCATSADNSTDISAGSGQASGVHPSTTYCLQDTGRYAHPGVYLRWVAEQTGWKVVSLVEGKVLRFNAGKPIYGNICALQWLS
jgi:predicted TPR repeat methyltransferase